jgi:hypothetical protein
MRQFTFAVSAVALTLTPASNAAAQCRDDSACPGGVCENGACVAPPAGRCVVDTDCPGQQPCSNGACLVAPATVPPTVNPPSASVAEGTVTFTSDEPGVEVSERSTESGEYTIMCRTPCTLQLTLGPHHLELGGWEANMIATGWPQEWRYDSGEYAMWGWGIAGTVVGSAAMATGMALMVAFRPRLCLGSLWYPSSESDCEHLPAAFYPGVSVFVTGAVLLVVGIALGALSEPVLNVTETDESADDTTTQTFALLPSVGPMPMGDGRTAWGFSLALTL